MNTRFVVLCAAAALLLTACKEDPPATTECQLKYQRLGAAPSSRVDMLFQPKEQVIKRLVREDGNEDSAAIFYRFDSPDVSARLHELDQENDGTIDSTMERSKRLVDKIDLYQVDAIADDDLVDSLQVSVPLTSNSFSGWTPTRMFYTIPCGPSHKLSATEDNGLVTIQVDLNEDGSIDTEMRMFFGDNGITAWTVDHEQDGAIDFRGKAEYNDDGKVTVVEWRNWEFDLISRSTWTYDEDGDLAGVEEDMNGDETIDNKLSYTKACWQEATHEK